MCLSHLFCRLLTVSIISLHVSTTCSISSFVLCSVHGTSISIFQMPQVVEYLLSAESMFRFHTTQHSKQMPLPYVSLSEGWGILAWGLFFLFRASLSQSSLPSYFVTTSTVFGHQTSEVHNKLFLCFQILSIHCDLHSSSFYHRHFYDFSFLHVDSHGMSSYEI